MVATVEPEGADRGPIGFPPGDTPSRSIDRATEDDETRLWRSLATRLGVSFFDRLAEDPLPADVEPPAPEVFRRADRLMLGTGDASALVAAPGESAVDPIADLVAAHPDLARRFALATPREIRRALVARHAPALVRRAVGAVLDRDPLHSAARTVSFGQVVVFSILAVAWVVAVADQSKAMLVAWTTAFLVIGFLRAHIAETVPDAVVHPPVAEADLPRIAVLVPLHREAEVMDDLVAHLLRLDYPADRLDLRLVVEADDTATRAAAEDATAGTAIEILVVPPAVPRTKPKALNFAFQCVDAPFLTVFDAEDRPDPDQLRRAVAAFGAAGPDLAVVQAALEIDHADDDRPWLVRQFEIEDAMLFHGLLPWLARRDLFLPLGGTSNLFRRAALAEVGGWDPHNVTEDADVAVRLMRRGWRADVIASSTLEEAPLDLARWHAQRVRWLKGWMQTWLAHMRRPWRFHREVTPLRAASFHVVLAGQLASVFVFAPSLLLFVAQAAGLLPFLSDRHFVDDLILAASLVGFSAGVAGSLVLARRVAGRGTPARRRRPMRLFDLVTMPVYWCLISFAAYRAFYELVAAPHRWNKTAHGLAERASDETGDDGASRDPASCASPTGEAMDGHPGRA